MKHDNSWLIESFLGYRPIYGVYKYRKESRIEKIPPNHDFLVGSSQIKHLNLASLLGKSGVGNQIP